LDITEEISPKNSAFVYMTCFYLCWLEIHAKIVLLDRLINGALMALWRMLFVENIGPLDYMRNLSTGVVLCTTIFDLILWGLVQSHI